MSPAPVRASAFSPGVPRPSLVASTRVTGDVDELQHGVDVIAAILGSRERWDVSMLEAIAAEVNTLLASNVPLVNTLDSDSYWAEVADLYGL